MIHLKLRTVLTDGTKVRIGFVGTSIGSHCKMSCAFGPWRPYELSLQ